MAIDLELVRRRVVEEPGRPAHVQSLFSPRDLGEGSLQRGQELSFGRRERRVVERAPHPGSPKAETCHAVIQVLPGPLRQTRIDRLPERHRTLCDTAGRRDHDDHDRARIEQQHFDVTDGRRLERRRRHERQHVRDTREHLAGRLEGRIDLTPQLRKVERERARTRILVRKQLVGVEAVALIGRNATRRRVRMHEQAEPLQLGERRADRRRRDAQPGALDEVLRADRLARGDVLLDDDPEDLTLAISEHHAHLQAFYPARSSAVTPPPR